MGLPPMTISADSPPELPPLVVLLLRGFNVLPNMLLTDSAIIMAVGTLVLTYKTAPAFSSVLASSESDFAGWST